MILFCDTSALLKLFIAEPGAELVAKQAATSTALAVNQYEIARQRLTDQWPAFITLELSISLAEQAARFADVFALRADDSVQLASAHLLHSAQADAVVFAGFDLRLCRAAATLGLSGLD